MYVIALFAACFLTVQARPNTVTSPFTTFTTPVPCSSDSCFSGLGASRTIKDTVRLIPKSGADHSQWYVVCQRLNSDPDLQPECLMCPGNLVWNENCKSCISKSDDLNDDCSGVPTTVSTTTNTPLPSCSLASYSAICSSDPPQSMKVRGDDPTQYLICNAPFQVCMRCPAGLVFKNAIQCCDWP